MILLFISNMAEKVEHVWYFAYGSNMATRVLSGRRRVYPKESIVATAPGFTLTFDILGLPYVEPSFGNIAKISNRKNKVTNSSLVEGVAHRITKQEYQLVIQTEGGGGNPEFGYQNIPIQLCTKEGKSFEACTLMAKTDYLQRGEARPSLRYLNILREGAQEHNLSTNYQQYLNSLSSYSTEKLSQKVGKFFMILVLSPILLPTVSIMVASMKLQFAPPAILYSFHHSLNLFAWKAYDYVFKPIFGSGE